MRDWSEDVQIKFERGEVSHRRPYNIFVPPKFGSATEQYVEVGKGKTMTYDIPMVKE